MLFCQLAQARSLREIVDGWKSCEGRLQHPGLVSAPKRSTLSYANAHRPWQLDERLFYDLLGRGRERSPGKKFRFKNRLLSIDSTTAEPCANRFDWATWRRTKGALKIRLVLDHDGCRPCFGLVSEGAVADVRVAQYLQPAIYQDRWPIELFFKRFKQQMRIKTFVGTSPNADQIQVWTARIAVLLLRYLQFRSKFRWALSNLVALLRWSLFSYRDRWEWLEGPFDTPAEPVRQMELELDSRVPSRERPIPENAAAPKEKA